MSGYNIQNVLSLLKKYSYTDFHGSYNFHIDSDNKHFAEIWDDILHFTIYAIKDSNSENHDKFVVELKEYFPQLKTVSSNQYEISDIEVDKDETKTLELHLDDHWIELPINIENNIFTYNPVNMIFFTYPNFSVTATNSLPDYVICPHPDHSSYIFDTFEIGYLKYWYQDFEKCHHETPSKPDIYKLTIKNKSCVKNKIQKTLLGILKTQYDESFDITWRKICEFDNKEFNDLVIITLTKRLKVETNPEMISKLFEIIFTQFQNLKNK